MPTIVHGFDWPDRLVVGTIGQPGARSFYLQARAGSRVTSVALEKQQSELLAAKIDEILDELMVAEGNPITIPATTPIELVDNEPLDQPVEPEFRIGAITLGWDPSTAQVVIEAYPYDDSEDGFDDSDEFGEATPPSEVLRVKIPVGTARAFAKRTIEVVGAGRPLCPLCATPMDPGGHTCPPLDDLL
ncbi:DUF3090 domain-containing protein [Frondihabitans sp. 4ASC-45]|uniref:DUF3090 domain-containing protein n=1 Tax=Frondihabitans sp. 4ASC-45 TaxID=3111636 RepID=UPI003C242138